MSNNDNINYIYHTSIDSMRYSELEGVKEYNDKKILQKIAELLILYSVWLLVYVIEIGFSSLLFIPYILVLMGYVIFSELNDERKKINDDIYNSLQYLDQKYHKSSMELMDRF